MILRRSVMADNGAGRMHRIEANLERVGKRLNKLTRSMNAMIDHHDARVQTAYDLAGANARQDG